MCTRRLFFLALRNYASYTRWRIHVYLINPMPYATGPRSSIGRALYGIWHSAFLSRRIAVHLLLHCTSKQPLCEKQLHAASRLPGNHFERFDYVLSAAPKLELTRYVQTDNRSTNLNVDFEIFHSLLCYSSNLTSTKVYLLWQCGQHSCREGDLHSIMK